LVKVGKVGGWVAGKRGRSVVVDDSGKKALFLLAGGAAVIRIRKLRPLERGET